MSFDQFLAWCTTTAYPEPPEEGHTGITRQMVEAVAEVATLPPGSRVWDIGCGQAVAREPFHAQGWEAEGLVMTPEDRDACTAQGYPVQLGDMHTVSLPDPERRFDLLWCRHVLEHSPAPGYLLWRLKDAIRPGGYLYVEVPAPDTGPNHEANPNHYSVLGERGWRCLLEKIGYTIVERWRLDFMTHGAGPDHYFALLVQRP